MRYPCNYFPGTQIDQNIDPSYNELICLSPPHRSFQSTFNRPKDFFSFQHKYLNFFWALCLLSLNIYQDFYSFLQKFLKFSWWFCPHIHFLLTFNRPQYFYSFLHKYLKYSWGRCPQALSYVLPVNIQQTPSYILPINIQQTKRFLHISAHISKIYLRFLPPDPSYIIAIIIQQTMRFLLISAQISKFSQGLHPQNPSCLLPISTFNRPLIHPKTLLEQDYHS